MKQEHELQEDRSHAIKSMEDIVVRAQKDSRPLTEEEKTEFDDLKAESERLDGQIKEVRETYKRMEIAHEKLESLKVPEGRITKPQPLGDGSGEGAEKRFIVPATAKRWARLKGFKGDQAEERAYRSGQWCRAVILGDESAARWCVRHGMELRAMSETKNTAGGHVVPEEMLQVVIDLRENYGTFRRHCKVVAMGRDVMTIPRRTGGVTAYFVDENTEITASDKAFDNVGLRTRKLAALTKISTELAEDAIINLADDLASEMAWAFAKKEDQCGFIGDGSATYGSMYGITIKIINGDHTAGAIDQTSGSDTFASVTAAELANLMGALPDYARDNAKFFCSAKAAEVVFGRLLAAGGGNTIQTLQGGYQRQYLGHEVVVSQVLPTIDAANALNDKAMLLFGDLSLAATLGDSRGLTVKTTEHRYFAEDQIGVKATERFDLNVHDLGDTSDAGPIVALIGNSS
jgi:HK97 family phage major capsid protein